VNLAYPVMSVVSSRYVHVVYATRNAGQAIRALYCVAGGSERMHRRTGAHGEGESGRSIRNALEAEEAGSTPSNRT